MYRSLETTKGDIEKDADLLKKTNKPLDPAFIDPLYRSRLKKQGKSHQTLITTDKNEVCETHFIIFSRGGGSTCTLMNDSRLIRNVLQ